MANSASQLKDLQNQLKNTNYTRKTNAQLKKQATGEYQSYYDQLRRAAQQQQQRNDLAIQQQYEGVERNYEKQREQSEKNYRLRYSQADRQMLSRGMQRSSYGAQVLANIDLEGAQAQNDLWDQQTAALGNLDAQRAQLAGQLADTLAGYDKDQAADVMKRQRELEDQDYDRWLASQNNRTSLSAQIYNMMYQAERDKIADQQWQKQFDESVRQFNEQQKKRSGGGGSSTKTAKNQIETGYATLPEMTNIWEKDPYDQFMDQLDGNTKPQGRTVPKASAIAQPVLENNKTTTKKTTKASGGSSKISAKAMT